MLAIIGASGKLGGATLSALLSNKLTEPSSIVAITSSQQGSDTWNSLSSRGVEVRHGTFDDGSTLEAALKGCAKFFLVSTPRVEMDYNDAPEGQGREKHHKTAIDAARKAGVQHIYYSSLAFDSPSKAGVMQAHTRTEAYLASLNDVKVTVIREGLYNESWPLYLGYYEPKADFRGVVELGGDGKINWTAIEDLGLGNALILAAPSEEYAGKTFYLASPEETAKSMREVAGLVAKARGKDVSVCIVSRSGYEDFYIDVRHMDPPAVKWWSSTYDALDDGECWVNDPTLSELLRSKGKELISLEETINAMVKG
ncbi:hypothetical protein BKA67DRAFT_194090 [Truncatella angustata]|uniref:NmrA-like domain-containing protein n=1 Tax=Truncatella angustata TaxID=152316 RepID=A0A9P8USS5_9PEZI|nr:uncharacterized protein BKA67DRAFT_194090 [Truncatella angustata]KAH6657641.1 hypothetical protein BKA67DRAFT_194090 [Truncatella angustata]KAH8194226.1 hypothetical protein TruAng_011613 [Truncatella angustata]